jgi:hypothetical protein
MKKTPKIDKLLADGWDLTVTRRNDGTFHATVHLGRRHGPDSHHCIRESLADVLTCLESYIDSPEQLSERGES